ncbi:MAG: glycosyltransferase [Chromatiales bacterium]|nr:glycosyltransferase [Chromatiales bacterium]
MSVGPNAEETLSAASISVSLVHFRSDLRQLSDTLRGLEAARIAYAAAGAGPVSLYVVDNTPQGDPALDGTVRDHWRGPLQLLRPGRNLGFGAGHNLALAQADGEFHLILNPDVYMEPQALLRCARYLRGHRRTVMLSPQARGGEGQRVYLCKRFPSVLALLLRGFAPAWLRQAFRRRLDHYEYRGETEQQIREGVLIASGFFMFARRRALQAINGFSPRFFLYFEDFDLSLRIASQGRIDYFPAVCVVHYGGHSSRKGIRHILLFVRSAITFFSIHGWRWW